MNRIRYLVRSKMKLAHFFQISRKSTKLAELVRSKFAFSESSFLERKGPAILVGYFFLS